MMKRTLLLVLSTVMTIIMMAGDVTPEKALQQAQRFVQERVAATGNSHRVSGTPQLKMAARVSGLYVFNVVDQGGYVIVSNDDRTFDVLGYSDSGNFDADNMPDNMRAWLQGYADEIAWLDAHNIQTVPVANQPLRAAKAPIAPLIETTWDQDAPYNNLCPEYISGEKSATGCVATAMAQVMKYHEWPTAATVAIPGYTKDYNNSPCIPVDALPAITFNWANMIEDYSSGYTSAQGIAVAQLMQYCGASLKMSYGESSSSNTIMIPSALKTYFNYNSTATFVSRSNYSYGNWINLMYHELAENRPICYGGSSSGGGHEFVCDGYQGEDYFHINWGWGGMSDDYFKLSALNPYAQGIGGSSSNDGFHYGQDAAIGIQKPSDEGTILTVPTNNYNLSLVSITTNKTNITTGETAEITLKVNNSGADDYDGDLWLYVNGGGLWSGNMFQIPAGGTKDCTIIFDPGNYTGTFQIYAMEPVDGGYNYLNYPKSVTVTVTTGKSTTNNITLGRSLVVDNLEGSDFYGSIFKGVLTVSNPESEYNYYGIYQFDIYNIYDYSLKWRFNDYITVPANGSVEIPFELTGTEVGKSYTPQVVYIKNDAWSSWDNLGTFACKPGITTYASDGTSTVTKVTSTSYSAPTGKLAVDLTGTGITTVSNVEPNCVFIIGASDTEPSGSTNIIKRSGSTYTADNITLTDGNGFYSPIDFTANNIEFNYNFTVAADGSNGWNTLMLPFDVTKVTADGTEIDWFHSSSDTGKNFWVKEFASDAPATVNFAYASTMKANTPYIVAFPGNKWGAAWDMSGKDIKFIGEATTVHKGGTISSVTCDNFRFIGSNVQDNTANIYCINATGNAFELKASGGSAPFRAYFKPGIFDSELTSLGIGSDTGTTGITDLRNKQEETGNKVYNLNGQRVNKPTKGLYIVNGKKILVK